MGIRFQCPNGHKLNVKADLAGKRGLCPECGAKFVIPAAAVESSPIGLPAVALSNAGNWYVRPPGGEQQFGPADDTLFSNWITEGRVAADSLVRRDGWSDWRFARDAADDLPIPLAAKPIVSVPVAEVAVAPAAIVSPQFAETDAADIAALPIGAMPPVPATLAASNYTFNRRRSKKSQIKLAVFMLVAVIVLAVVLVLVLRFNGSPVG